MKPKYFRVLLQSRLFIILSLIYFPAYLQAHALDLKPYEVQYQSTIRGFNVKTARILQQQNSNFELTQKISTFIADTEESSSFKITSDNTITPLNYIYKRSFLGKKMIRTTKFQPDLHTASFQENNDPITNIKLENAVYDPLNSLIPLRIQLAQPLHEAEFNSSVYVLKKDRVKKFVYHINNVEWLKTPLGYIETIKVDRLQDSKKKQTSIWLAKDWDYILVKIIHQEPDEPTYQMEIVSGVIGGRKIIGKPAIPITNL